MGRGRYGLLSIWYISEKSLCLIGGCYSLDNFLFNIRINFCDCFWKEEDNVFV